MENANVKYLVGDVFDRMAELEDGSVDLILTSPPFLALRSYLPADHPDKDKEIGSEATPAEYIDVLLGLTAEWRRLLAPHGSLVVELGDTYSGSGGAGGDWIEGSGNRVYKRGDDLPDFDAMPDRKGTGWPLAKSLTLIPEAYRFALAYGTNPHTGQPSPAGQWRIRNVIRWVRPNPPVGALGDKFRPATSELVVACVSKDRYFDLDAVREPYAPGTLKQYKANPDNPVGEQRPTKGDGAKEIDGQGNAWQVDQRLTHAGAPPLDWWKLSPKGYAGAHYAVWPSELCVKPIKAMCPKEVCRECGEPRRRITSQYSRWRDIHPQFRDFLRAARAKSGLSQKHVDEHFGFNGMMSHWERAIHSDKAQPAIPNPDQWNRLKDLLSIEDTRYDELVAEFDNWTDRHAPVGYVELLQETRNEGFYLKGEGQARASTRGPSTTAQIQTIGWSDCGHDNYRPGLVLDPFAGTGTTLAVAHGHGRDAIGIDIDERSAELARERVGPLFLEVVGSV